MTLRKKIVLSNILTVVLPIVVAFIIWTGYVHFNSGSYLRPIRRASEGGDTLTEAMNILYTFEAELSDMEWDAVAFQGKDGPEIVISPDRERIEELESLGYHIQVESPDDVLYTNLDEEDKKILGNRSGQTDGSLSWSGDSLVICDGFRLSGQDYNLTAVYNKNRVDLGVQNSLIPMYMVSPTVLLVLLLAVLICIALTTIIMSGWMNRSVLVPLEELKKGTDRIAVGDLDYSIDYESKDEIGDVCREFDHMRIQLKEAKLEQKRYDDQKRSLLRGISHDIRSPLTSIKGYAQGLRDGIAATEEKRTRYCNAILTRADDIERLTDSLSHLVKLENDSSVLHLQRVCLDEYIHQLLAEKEDWIAEQKIDVDYRTEAEDAEVFLDIREMQRVFMNLFENTVRYRTSDRSKVKLNVHLSEHAVEICFADDGPGVDEVHLPNIFEPFYRADESRTDPGSGSGIGLAVVRQIIEGQNGQVTAESERGLCIVMRLPAAEHADGSKTEVRQK